MEYYIEAIMITEDQRKERLGYLGSSDCAAVLGLSRWKTPMEVWAEKTGAIIPEDISGKLAIEVGVGLEDLCAKLFEKRTGKKTHRVNETVYHPNFKFIAANLDRRVVAEDALLECKTAGAWAAREWSGEDMPQEVIVQVMHQLACTGKAYGYACVLIGGNQDYVWKRIDRDPALIADMVGKLAHFWTAYVEPKVMPQIVTKDDASVLYKLFPNGQEQSTVGLSAEANTLVESIQNLQSEQKKIEDVIEQEKNALRLMLGDNAIGVTDRFKVTWKTQTTERFDSKKFRETSPAVYQEYVKQSQSRVLRFAALKEKK